MLWRNFSLCIKALLTVLVGQPDDENDFPINQEGPTRVIIVSDDDEPRKVTYCGEATTGENKSCFLMLKGNIPLLMYLTKRYCLIKKKIKQDCLTFNCEYLVMIILGNLVMADGVLLVPVDDASCFSFFFFIFFFRPFHFF